MLIRDLSTNTFHMVKRKYLEGKGRGRKIFYETLCGLRIQHVNNTRDMADYYDRCVNCRHIFRARIGKPVQCSARPDDV